MNSQSKLDQVNAIPADAAVTEIVLLCDVEGVEAPVLVTRDFSCVPPKEHGYTLRGPLLMLNAKGLAKILEGRVESALQMASISPLDLVANKVKGGDGVDHVAKHLPMALQNGWASGVSVFYARCLRSAKAEMLQRVLEAAHSKASAGFNRHARAVGHLNELARRHQVNLYASDDGRELAAARSAAALLPDTPAGHAAREALSALGADDLRQLQTELGQTIYHLVSVYTTASEAAEHSRLSRPREEDPKALDFEAANGIPFTARVVLQGDEYGAFREEQWALRYDAKAPLIEFFDRRYPHTPYGQFTGGRYLLSTLSSNPDLLLREGLLLNGDVPPWTVDAQSLRRVIDWAGEVAETLRASDAEIEMLAGRWEDTGRRAFWGRSEYVIYSSDAGDERVYNVAKAGERMPEGAGGYRDLAALLQLKGLVEQPAASKCKSASPEP